MIGGPALLAGAEAVSAAGRADTLWTLAMAAVALLTVPGLVLAYGGMAGVRATARIAVAAASGIALVVVIWLEIGFGAVYGPDWIPHLLGDPLSSVGLQHLTGHPAAVDAGRVAFAGFQLLFPIVAVTIVATGAAGRMRMAGWLSAVAVWTVVVLLPVMRAVFDLTHGWAVTAGVNDFAGGIAVNATAGAACLGFALALRHGIPGDGRGGPRRNAPLSLVGMMLLPVGWVALTAGAEGAVDGTTALVWINTIAAAAGGVLAAMVVGAIGRRIGRWAAATAGMLSGLAAISAGCNTLTPSWSLVTGAVAGVIGCLLLQIPAARRAGPAAAAALIHLPAAISAAVFLGVFASGIGFVATGSTELVTAQVAVTVAAAAYSFAVAWVIGTAYTMLSRGRRRQDQLSEATKGVR